MPNRLKQPPSMSRLNSGPEFPGLEIGKTFLYGRFFSSFGSIPWEFDFEISTIFWKCVGGADMRGSFVLKITLNYAGHFGI